MRRPPLNASPFAVLRTRAHEIAHRALTEDRVKYQCPPEKNVDSIDQTMQNDHERSLLEAALTGLEAQKSLIAGHIFAVRSQLVLGGPGRPRLTQTKAEIPTPGSRKRRMSAAGRRAISEPTRKRWAAVRAHKEVPGAPAPRKQAMSAAERRESRPRRRNGGPRSGPSKPRSRCPMRPLP
jgi:hypothetical protein